MLNTFFFFGLYSTVGFEVPSIALMKGLMSGFMNATQYYCGSCNLLNSQEKTPSKLDHCRHLWVPLKPKYVKSIIILKEHFFE